MTTTPVTLADTLDDLLTTAERMRTGLNFLLSYKDLIKEISDGLPIDDSSTQQSGIHLLALCSAMGREFEDMDNRLSKLEEGLMGGCRAAAMLEMAATFPKAPQPTKPTNRTRTHNPASEGVTA